MWRDFLNFWRRTPMNGTKEPVILAESMKAYRATPDPYKSAPSMGVNLLELSRYARKMGKEMCELTKEEFDLFKI